MFRVRKQFKFEMGHRLRSAYSACCRDQVHGHSFICEVFLEAEELNEDGMVLDFGELKALIGNYIDSFDHRLALPKELAEDYSFPSEKVAPLVFDFNPTAEELAREFYFHIRTILTMHFRETETGPDPTQQMRVRLMKPMRVRLMKVRLHETATGWAEYEEYPLIQTKIPVTGGDSPFHPRRR